MPRLPAELLDLILDHLYHWQDEPTISACALAGRALVCASRAHRFRDIAVYSVARAETFRDLCAASGDLGLLVRHLTLFPSTRPRPFFLVRDMFQCLPRLPHVVEVTLLGLTLIGDTVRVGALRSIQSKIPSLRHLCLIICSFKPRQVFADAVSFYPSLDSITVWSSTMTCSTSERSPSVLCGVYLHFTGHQLALMQLQLRLLWWFIEQPAPEASSHMRRVCNSHLTDLLTGISHVFVGYMNLQHLDLVVDWLALRTLKDRPDDTPWPLSACKKLQTITLHFVISSKRWTKYPHLSDINTLLAELNSRSLTTITLAVHTAIMRDVHAPSVEARDVQWEELCALDWRGIETQLLRPKLAGLKKFVVYGGGGDKSSLRSHLEEQCSGLLERNLIDLA
ncbi:uncharacterized protein C8Q71DRAFT_311696 [Rhodofomes roseus]|uniref:F-box domain-containing protein n=1 Tax=Rhodofomes roseus TaxID=34475 RepID=A0ABQ8K325_9APHY|nr:uncharacterized protein C8Q71DRAFT_311696 [Rhodofomes roseus]KAH9831255.1 hypothetical protein C8Q71DRAFT_311696 [Rhodofomes roseus]